MAEVGISTQVGQLLCHAGFVVGHVLYFPDKLGKVEGFNVDAVLLHGDFVKAHGLESSGTRTDAAQIEALHAVYHAANGGEIAQVLLERRAEGMHHVRLENGKGHLVLREYVRHGELAAVGVAAMGKVHFADLVRIGLHQNRHARVLQGGDGAVFVHKDGHAEDHAVILPLVLLEPSGVLTALVARFHRAVAGGGFLHHDVVIARVGHGFDHVVTRPEDQFSGHEPAVTKAQRKRHLLFHRCFILSMILFIRPGQGSLAVDLPLIHLFRCENVFSFLFSQNTKTFF